MGWQKPCDYWNRPCTFELSGFCRVLVVRWELHLQEGAVPVSLTVSRMILESLSRKDFSPPGPHATRGTAADHAAAPPVIARSRRLFLPTASVAGLVFLLMCVSIVVKWNVPLPRCAFKTVTGFPCFTCGSTRALAALGRFEVLEALKFNPLVTLACTAAPVWLGIALLNVAFAPRLRLRLAFRLKTILSLLIIAAIGNWIYLLLELPR